MQFKSLSDFVPSAPTFDIFNMTPEQMEEHDRQVEEFEKQEDEEHAYHNFMICGAEKNYLKNVDFKNYVIIDHNMRQTSLKSMAIGMVQEIREGKYTNFVMLGASGVGKTYTALCILKEVCRMTYSEIRDETSPIMKIKYPTYEIKRWHTGIYTTSEDLNNRLHEAESYSAKLSKDKVIRQYTYCKLLIIDEIGRTSKKVEKDNLFSIVDKRHQNGLPTIFISNMQKDEFINAMGSALADRILASNRFWTDGSECINMRQRLTSQNRFY